MGIALQIIKNPSKKLDFLHSFVGITGVTIVDHTTITLTQRERRQKGHQASQHGHAGQVIFYARCYMMLDNSK